MATESVLELVPPPTPPGAPTASYEAWVVSLQYASLQQDRELRQALLDQDRELRQASMGQDRELREANTAAMIRNAAAVEENARTLAAALAAPTPVAPVTEASLVRDMLCCALSGGQPPNTTTLAAVRALAQAYRLAYRPSTPAPT